MQSVLLKTNFIQSNDVRVGQFQQRLDFLLVDALVPAIVLLLHLLDRDNLTCIRDYLETRQGTYHSIYLLLSGHFHKFHRR